MTNPKMQKILFIGKHRVLKIKKLLLDKKLIEVKFSRKEYIWIDRDKIKALIHSTTPAGDHVSQW